MDEMVIVDDVATAPVAMGATAARGHQWGGAEQQLQPIIVEVDAQGVADQPRRHRVEHLAYGEARVRGDLDALHLEVLTTPRGQRPEHGAFGVDAGSMACVVATDDLGDEGAIGGKVLEFARAAQRLPKA